MTDIPEDEQEFTVEAQELFISRQPIELYKVLKMANLVNSGGEAKMVIAEGYVGLNGQQECQKRKKIVDGDLIEFNGEYLYIVYAPDQQSDTQQAPTSQDPTPPSNTAQPAAKASAKKSSPNTNKKTGRGAIKF